MSAKLDRRQSRLLALVLFIVLVTLLVAAVAIPVLAANRHFDELIEGMNDQLQVYQRVARHSDQYQTAYAQLQRLRRSDRRYLKSNTESLATAELQRVVKQIISRNKGEILSAQVVRSKEEEGFKRIAVRIRMKSSLENMIKALHTLETQNPYLFINAITVRSRNMARRRLPSTKALEKAVAQLDIDFQLSGYMRGEDK